MIKGVQDFQNLLLFFLIAFGFSWMFWVPQALVSTGLLSVPSTISDFLFSPFNPAAFGPAVSAFLLTYLRGGSVELRSLLAKGVDYNFKRAWYIPIFLLFPAISGGALLLAVLSGEPMPSLTALSNPPFLVVAFAYIFFLGGPFQEEWGWRGYALNRLQARLSASFSSVLLGIVWGAWHFPLFFISGTIQSQTPMWGFMILIVCGSIIFTWVFNNTGGSILAVMILHTMNNLSFLIFPTLETTLGALYLLLLSVATAMLILLKWSLRG